VYSGYTRKDTAISLNAYRVGLVASIVDNRMFFSGLIRY
jgi:hypothetical protein